MMTSIAIMAGSGSDLPVIKESKMAATIESVGFSYRVDVCSAHRNPEELKQLVDELAGVAQVYIGVAGMAAALPGALAGASKMATPVIAVPLDEHGIDSCLYMPPGVPVALAGVGTTGLKNAALLACQILCTDDPDMRRQLDDHVRATNKEPQFKVSLEEVRTRS
jgi:5-(carboxyamino)imidazole ribonucleotide mutase